MRLLLIEDDAAFARSLKLRLAEARMSVDLVALGREGLHRASSVPPDLILLDLGLPDMDGMDVIARMRAKGLSVPIIVLTGSDCMARKVKALGCGADDYLVKPVAAAELAARIEAVPRRCRGAGRRLIPIGPCATLHLDEQILTAQGRPVGLTPKQYALLELLALRRGAVLSRRTIMQHLYRAGDAPRPKAIDVFVCKLRKKLLAVGPCAIETVPGRGYRLAA